MAEPKTQSMLTRRAQIKTGNNSLLGLARAVSDPALAVLSLFLSTLVWGHAPGTAEMIAALVAFSLMYPGSVPFAVGQRGLIRDLLSQWGVVLGLMLMFGLAIDVLDDFDTKVLATWVIATPIVQALVHVLAPLALPHLNTLRGRQTAIIIGANELGRTLARQLTADPYSNVRVSAFFDDREQERLGDVREAPISGRIERVAEFVRANRVDQIYIALPMASQPRILRLLDELRDTTASIYFVPDIFLYDLIQARVDTVVGLPVVAVCETPFHGTTGMLKRLSDLLIAATAVVLTAPIMLALAIAIKITMPGPVLFRQRRYGLDGREITVWKFRSMKVAEDGDQVRQATRDDDRITPLGSFMRRTSLDELPQFFNVLSGQMSVVGPRPHAVVHNETYRKLIKGYMIRHKVKPGITGWAQVNGARGETETIEKMERRINYDLEYLRNWSLRLDLVIILRTVLQAFGRDPNAY
ncbi:MAG: undecaprenyl-phosphate glucose phosphotransferase [Burkholderiaceae bacterium]